MNDIKDNNRHLDKVTTFVCLDIETTGLNPETDKIIEIGALKVKDKKIVGQFNEFINPNIPLSPKIIQLTGITNDMLDSAKEEEEVIKRFLEFVGDDILIGHNLIFDYSFIKIAAQKVNNAFERKGIDTLFLSKKLLPGQKSKSLTNLCHYFNITNENAHRAYDDAKATTYLYVNLSNLFHSRQPNIFQPKSLHYKVKKPQSITTQQRNYLLRLIKYHNINDIEITEHLSKSDASKLIDKIISEKGKMN